MAYRGRIDSSNSAEEDVTVGQYVAQNIIGEGTFGKVRAGLHSLTGEKVAIKILEKARFKGSEDTKRVNREIKILKKARHSNIIQLFEVVDTAESIHLVMESADGGEMFDFIVRNRKLSETLSCNFFHQIVNGVEALHLCEITHRDLKPENLLLKSTPSGWLIKIVDFGLSNTHEGGRLLATACGSPCYAAPEMIAGKKYFGPLIDIWSMGVILFTLVCGYLPFEDQNTNQLYKKILAGSYSAPKWLSANVRDLIRKILEVNPKKRYSISDIRAHAWYLQVKDSDIPIENILSNDDKELEAETLKSLKRVGLNVKELSEEIASKSHNPLTASYFLMKTKLYHSREASKPVKPTNAIAESSVIPTATTTMGAVPTTAEGDIQPQPKPSNEDNLTIAACLVDYADSIPSQFVTNQVTSCSSRTKETANVTELTIDPTMGCDPMMMVPLAGLKPSPRMAVLLDPTQFRKQHSAKNSKRKLIKVDKHNEVLKQALTATKDHPAAQPGNEAEQRKNDDKEGDLKFLALIIENIVVNAALKVTAVEPRHGDFERLDSSNQNPEILPNQALFETQTGPAPLQISECEAFSRHESKLSPMSPVTDSVMHASVVMSVVPPDVSPKCTPVLSDAKIQLDATISTSNHSHSDCSRIMFDHFGLNPKEDQSRLSVSTCPTPASSVSLDLDSALIPAAVSAYPRMRKRSTVTSALQNLPKLITNKFGQIIPAPTSVSAANTTVLRQVTVGTKTPRVAVPPKVTHTTDSTSLHTDTTDANPDYSSSLVQPSAFLPNTAYVEVTANLSISRSQAATAAAKALNRASICSTRSNETSLALIISPATVKSGDNAWAPAAFAAPPEFSMKGSRPQGGRQGKNIKKPTVPMKALKTAGCGVSLTADIGFDGVFAT